MSRSVRCFAVALVILLGCAWILDEPTPGSSAPLGPALRLEQYRGVEVAVPDVLPLFVRPSGLSTCDPTARSGVYFGTLAGGGMCDFGIDPTLLSVTLSPLDSSSAALAGPQPSRFVKSKVVKSRRIVVIVWFGVARRADAARILASAHAT